MDTVDSMHPYSVIKQRDRFRGISHRTCLSVLMDLAGIEPASESLFTQASPITVAGLTFPRQYAHRQAYRFSSFIIHLPGQSLSGKVSHIVDARFLMCECIRADELPLGC